MERDVRTANSSRVAGEHRGDVDCFLHPLDAPMESDGLTSNIRGDGLAATTAA
jgi:hypothetical protein